MTTGRKSATKSWDNSRPFCVKFSLVLRSIQLTKTKCSLGKIPFNFNCQKTTSDEKICRMYFSDCALYYGEKSRRLKLRTEEQGPPVRRNTWGGRVVVDVVMVVVGRGGGASSFRYRMEPPTLLMKSWKGNKTLSWSVMILETRTPGAKLIGISQTSSKSKLMVIIWSNDFQKQGIQKCYWKIPASFK